MILTDGVLRDMARLFYEWVVRHTVFWFAYTTVSLLVIAFGRNLLTFAAAVAIIIFACAGGGQE